MSMQHAASIRPHASIKRIYVKQKKQKVFADKAYIEFNQKISVFRLFVSSKSNFVRVTFRK